MRTYKKRASISLLKLASLCLILLLALGTAQALAEATPDYTLMSVHNQWVYDYNNGMPSISINSIIQSQDGYIWMASHGGLIRFSGEGFVTFSPETDEAFPTYNMMALFEDSQGRMWVGTSDGGALVYENHVFRQVETENKTLSVTAFAEMADGTVLMGTKEGLYQIDAQGAAALIDASPVIEQMIVDNQNNTWLLCAGGDLKAPEGFPTSLIPAHKYSSLFEDSRGNILLGTGLGRVVVLENKGDYSFTLREVDASGLNQINAFCEDGSGSIWICADSGLGHLTEAFAYQPADGAKLNSALWSATVDHEGGVWIASSRNGVLHLMPTVIRDVNFAAGLGERVTNSAVLYQNVIYAGTDSGLDAIDSQSFQVLSNELTEFIGGIRVRCLTVDSQENLWVSTYERYGTVRYSKDGTITYFNTENGLISDKARQVLELSDGTIAVATNDGFSLIKGDEVTASYGMAQGLSNPVVLSLVEEEKGRLLIGTDGGGIFVLEDGVISPLDVGDLDSRVILRMYYGQEEKELWIATGSSFYHYQNGQLQSLPHIFNEVKAVFDIIPIGEGKLCLLATEGIYAGTQQDLLQNTEDLVLIRIQGTLPYHITANSWNRIDKEGNLFLCAAKELGLFNVKYLANNATHAQLIVDSITVDNQRLAPAEEIRMDSDAMRLTVSVNTPHFGFVEKFTFEYELEGFDTKKQYLPAGTINDITYTNLPGGEYVFHVAALNGVGERGGTASFRLVKEKHLLERPETWVVGGLLLLLLFILFIRLGIRHRTRKILQKQEEYRRTTNQAINIISHAIDAKDEYTVGHSRRVAEYSVEIGRRLGLNEDELEKLRYIALLHDIGKIGIHDNILNKPGRLTDDEFALMKSHTVIGANILKGFDAVPNISEGAVAHHEKYDGTGYPKGIKGEEISLTSRIIGVCDTYDAMATTRAYRKALDKDFIIGELEKHKGKQFDPAIVDIMVQMINDGFMDHFTEREEEHVKPVAVKKVNPEEMSSPAQEDKPSEGAQPRKPEEPAPQEQGPRSVT